MEPRISIICLGVGDLERSLRFYRDGLGLPTTRSAEDGIVFFQTSGVTLELFPYHELAADVGPGFDVPRTTFPGITIAHNVRTKAEVDDVLRQAEAPERGSKSPRPRPTGAATAAISPTRTGISGKSPTGPSTSTQTVRSRSRSLSGPH